MIGTLEGKIAIVTGGTRGIGRAIAELFVERGVKGIAITYASSDAAAQEAVKAFEAKGAKAVAIKADMKDMDIGTKVVRETLKGLGTDKIDILVNNAGVGIQEPLLGDKALEAYSANFDTNVRGPILLIRAVLPVIRRGGRIINTSSRQSKTSPPDPWLFYSASKAALNSVTKSVAGVASHYGITVNTLMPGPVDTDMMTVLDPKFVDSLRQQPTAEKRLGTVDDIAQCAGFLAEDGSRWINGDVISATGGAWMP